MTNFGFLFAVLICVGGLAAVAYWVGRRLQKGAQTAAVEEARQRMESIPDNDLPSTADRLRRGDF